MFEKKAFKKATLMCTVVGLVIVAWSGVASACGGFFCQATPVDQTGERIIFTVNDDQTTTALIEILYQGASEDFSWILPIPHAIEADALSVPANGAQVFDELHDLTDVQLIAPAEPPCTWDWNFGRSVDAPFSDINSALSAESASGPPPVTVFSSGEVGPFEFDVIGADDPDELLNWLRDNRYQVAPSMEPLIDVYVEQEMAFIAMRLLDGQNAGSIEPIEITYPGTTPTIPLRLTAVAAQPNFPVWVWIFGEDRAVPTNFDEIEVSTQEITFFPNGGNDYPFLVQQRADAFGGHAFITEYAQGVGENDFSHPWLRSQGESSSHLTRLTAFLDPDEMTVDPTFDFDGSRGDVSNVRDATGLHGLYSCERDNPSLLQTALFGSHAIDPTNGGRQVVASTPGGAFSSVGGRLVFGTLFLVGVAFVTIGASRPADDEHHAEVQH